MFKKYKELEREILSARMDLELAITRKDKIVSTQGPKDVQAQQYVTRVSNSKIFDLNEVYSDLTKVQTEINTIAEHLDKLEDLQKKFLSEIKKFKQRYNDLETEVFIRHHVNRQPLIDIALDLNYSYIHIKRTNSEIIKKLKKHDTKMIHTELSLVI